MNNEIVYNIPTRMVDSYHDCNLILRSTSPVEIAYGMWRTQPTNLRFIQLLTPTCDTSLLEGTGEGVPIEIILSDPNKFQTLYDFTNLLDSHPIRIVIPVVRGFTKAVKLATALNYSIRLEMEQPTAPLMKEIEGVLDHYLHRSSVRQPIEFFQSLLLSFYQDAPVSLWDIAEENPAEIRYITEDGSETISRRFFGMKLEGDLADFVGRFQKELIEEEAECNNCDYFSRCRGYFKWPNKNYRCDDVKRMFLTLEAATVEVRRDLEQHRVMRKSA